MTDAPRNADPNLTLYGYTHHQLRLAMIGAFQRGLNSRAQIDQDSVAAAGGDTAAHRRLITAELDDTRTAAGMVEWRATRITSPASVKKLIEFAEVYGRWRENSPVVDQVARSIDASITYNILETDADRTPPFKLPTLEEVDLDSWDSMDARANYTPPFGLDRARATLRVEQLEQAAVKAAPASTSIETLRAQALDGLAAPGVAASRLSPERRHLHPPDGRSRPDGLTL